jgi:hypothetical protein
MTMRTASPVAVVVATKLSAAITTRARERIPSLQTTIWSD